MLQDVSAVTLDVNLLLVNLTGVNRADRSVCLWMHHLWKPTVFHKWLIWWTSLRFCVGHQRLVVADVVESVELVLRKHTNTRRYFTLREEAAHHSFLYEVISHQCHSKTFKLKESCWQTNGLLAVIITLSREISDRAKLQIVSGVFIGCYKLN